MPPKDEHLKMPTKTLSAKGHCALGGWSLLFFPSPLVHCHLHCPRFSQVTHSPESSRERPYHASADTDLSVETSEFRVLAPRHPFFPRRSFPLPPCSPPSRSPLPSPVLATPSVVPALRVFPLSPSLPHLTQLPPVVVRSLSLSLRVALSPALLGTSVLPLVLYHYLFFTFSLVLSNVFLPSYPTYRRIAALFV